MVIGTHDRPRNHVFPYVYTPYLVLITMFPRNTIVQSRPSHKRAGFEKATGM